MKRVGYKKNQLKDKFDSFYKDGESHWKFDQNDRLYRKKRELVELFIDKSKYILDLGCAEGNFLVSIIESNDNKVIVGVDIAENAIALAKNQGLYNELYVSFIDDIHIYTQHIQEYDLILLNEVLYYVDNYIQTLDTILKLSSKYIFISLAMGPQFFTKSDLIKIKKSFKTNGYKLIKQNLYDMDYKLGIPIRFLEKFYRIVRGIELKQTHKYILIYEKI